MRWPVAASVLLMLVVVSGCDAEDAAEPPQDVTVSDPTVGGTTAGDGPTVVLAEIEFQPDRIAVAPGTTISFVHEDGGTPHTVTARDGSFESGQLEQGQVFTVTVEEAGEIPFYCQVHPDRMQGVIEISDGD